ncbi:MAG: HAD family hydrolase [Alphaproteobacteria bacterium]
MTVVVFDMDGTLVEREYPLAWATASVINNLKLSFKTIEGLKEIHSVWKDKELFDGIDLETQKEIYEKQIIPDIIQIEMTKEFYNQIKLFPNIENLLKILFELDYKLMVCTSRDTESTSELLKYLNIRKYFINVIGTLAGRFINDKPSPIPVHYMMNESGIDKTEQIFTVGDSKKDIQLAKNLNGMGIGVCYEIPENKNMLKKENPIAIIDKVNDILKIKDIIVSNTK